MSDSSTNSWYSTQPQIGHTVMFTTGDTNEIGYSVTMDEYSDQEAFLPFSELSARHIRKNPASFLKHHSKHCGNITDIGDGNMYISLKGVSKEQKKTHSELYGLNTKLFSLCRRLSHFDFTTDEWHKVFQTVMERSLEQNTTHPYTVITDRFGLRDTDDKFMDSRYVEVILNNHATIFGMKPYITESKLMLVTFDCDGNQLTKEEITRVLSELKPENEEYSDEILYEQQGKFNLSVAPVALPIFRFTVTAYQDTVSKAISTQLSDMLKNGSRFDICIPA